MYLLRVLLMPLQIASLLFVGLLGLGYAAATLVVGSVPYLWMLPALFVLYYLAKYGYAMLEQAAEGLPLAPVASVELLGPFEGRGPGAQLLAGLALYLLMRRVGGAPALATAVLGALLLPASVGTLGLTHRLRDALNPLALARVIAGLGYYYLLMLVVVAGVAAADLALLRVAMPQVLQQALCELLTLMAFCVIGGCLYQRRLALGFEPRASPERDAELRRREHERSLQRTLDGMYEPLRARNYPSAQQRLRDFLAGTTAAERATDVPVIMARVLQWQDERSLVAVSDCLLAELLESGEPRLALAVLERTREQLRTFTPATAEQAQILASFARSVGRTGLAASLLERAPLNPP